MSEVQLVGNGLAKKAETKISSKKPNLVGSFLLKERSFNLRLAACLQKPKNKQMSWNSKQQEFMPVYDKIESLGGLLVILYNLQWKKYFKIKKYRWKCVFQRENILKQEPLSNLFES